jgi:transposase-like protein
MPAKNKPTGTDADFNAVTLQPLFADEDMARAFIESKRWPNGPVCPHCKATEVYKLTAKPGSKSPVRPGVYKCSKCRKQFTVRVGSIFEDSKLPLRHWLYAIHLMTSSKKGVSSHQIARELGITVKSAWFVTHRIREAMKLEPMAGMLKGEIEADETYVGPRRARYPVGKRGPRGLKKPVVALVERGGRVHSRIRA